MAEFMKPIVSISGTSRKELINQRVEVSRAISQLQETMVNMLPHGRDYVGDPDRFKRDRKICRERWSYLEKLRGALLDEADFISRS